MLVGRRAGKPAWARCWSTPRATPRASGRSRWCARSIPGRSTPPSTRTDTPTTRWGCRHSWPRRAPAGGRGRASWAIATSPRASRATGAPTATTRWSTLGSSGSRRPGPRTTTTPTSCTTPRWRSRRASW